MVVDGKASPVIVAEELANGGEGLRCEDLIARSKGCHVSEDTLFSFHCHTHRFDILPMWSLNHLRLTES